FFQAEDGIRDRTVTGVQTCALPICGRSLVVGQQVGDQLRGRFGVAGVARGHPGRGDDLTVRVDSDMALVPVEAAMVGLVPVPGQIGRASCRERVEVSVVGGGWEWTW